MDSERNVSITRELLYSFKISSGIWGGFGWATIPLKLTGFE